MKLYNSCIRVIINYDGNNGIAMGLSSENGTNIAPRSEFVSGQRDMTLKKRGNPVLNVVTLYEFPVRH